MGRVKLTIKRLESMNRRQITYSKRRAGIAKKATELSVLCDIDILLLMFSPTGKPTICLGEHSKFEDVIIKFAQLTPQERTKRKLESLEVLKKTFKKLDHDVNIPDFLGSSNQTIEELSSHLLNLKSQLFEMQIKLSNWTDPDNVGSIEQITQMEHTLQEALNRIQMQIYLIRNQLLLLDYPGEFLNAMQLHVNSSNEQQASNMQWQHHGDDQNFMFSGAPSLLPQRSFKANSHTQRIHINSNLGPLTLPKNEIYRSTCYGRFESRRQKQVLAAVITDANSNGYNRCKKVAFLLLNLASWAFDAAFHSFFSIPPPSPPCLRPLLRFCFDRSSPSKIEVRPFVR